MFSAVVQNNGAEQRRWPPPIVLAQPGGPVIYYSFKPRAARGPVMKNTRAMKHTSDETHARAVKSHQPSGLAWFRVVRILLCFHSLFFSTLQVSIFWGGVHLSPTPSHGPQTPFPAGRWSFLLRLVSHLVALRFFIVFSSSFLSDLGSILLPNLAPGLVGFDSSTVCFIARVFHYPCVFHYGATCSPWLYCGLSGCARTMQLASAVVLNNGGGQHHCSAPLFRTTALNNGAGHPHCSGAAWMPQ